MERFMKYLEELKTALDLIPMSQFDEIVDILHQARLDRKQVFVMGNGGSAATASHFMCDLAKATRKPDWPRFRAIGLNDNMAILSAYSNDEGYENALAEQMMNLIQPNDVVFAISCSGNSSNVIKAVSLAQQSDAVIIGLTGRDGGSLAGMCDVNISAQTDAIQQQEDIHSMICHMIIVALIELPETEVPTHQTVYAEIQPVSLD